MCREKVCQNSAFDTLSSVALADKNRRNKLLYKQLLAIYDTNALHGIRSYEPFRTVEPPVPFLFISTLLISVNSFPIILNRFQGYVAL